MNNFINKGDCVGLISCSDGRKQENASFIKSTIDALFELGLNVKLANTILRKGETLIMNT
ncbi:hypothetical protein [Bacillus sp. FSL K6-3431]|uniref:hypothetical protein n=1 Tax=Bacillus sp. FSL K6-3431 TaxID=2921500 RepID=UPI0030FBC41E